MAYAVLSRIVGAALLAAAFLKLAGLRVSPVSQSSLLTEPVFVLALVEWEALLGLALLTGAYPRIVHRLTIVTFAVFAAVSFWSGWVGQASCGCFGRAAVNPWIVFGFDVAVLAALVAFRPGRDAESVPLGRVARVGAIAINLFTVPVGVAALKTGTVEGALTTLRSAQVSVTPYRVDVGVQAGGETIPVRVRLNNWSDHEHRVVGGTSDCSCIATEDLPLTLAPGESREVVVYMQLPEVTGSFGKRAWFWADTDQRKIPFVIVGRAVLPKK